MTRFELTDQDYGLNASFDPYAVLKKMGFTEHSMYQEGDIVRVHCPIHKDLVRKSLIIDTAEKTFKCQYANCDAHEGGLLIELVAMYYDCEITEVSKTLFGEEDKSADLLFRGEMFINQGRHQEALPYLEQATDLNPRDEITRCKLAALYLELERKDDAYREYLQAAESYAVRGELDKTLSIYNILIMLQPGAVKARKELAYLFSRMGRPDASAEQLKWVVDFYMKYNQNKGAQETCEQIIELDPESGMAYFLLGTLMQKTGKRAQAVTNFEEAARKFMKAEEFSRARVAYEEAVALAPNNNRLQDLHEQIETAAANHVASGGGALSDNANINPQLSEDQEREFIDWLSDVDEKLKTGDSNAFTADVVRKTREQIPVGNINAEPGNDPRVSNDGNEIMPEDRRVTLCLDGMKELDAEQLEAMRQQLISMFTDVRKSYEEGLLSDWEMRTIKEFYKSFCVAVDMHRRKSAV